MMSMGKSIWWLAIIILTAFVLSMFAGCSSKKSKKPEFASKGEFEAAVTIAFKPYGIIGAQIPNNSNLMVMYAKGDFMDTYQKNEDDLQRLFRTWLDKLYTFKGSKESVGIMVRQGLKEVLHASRVRKGQVLFQIMGQ
jgi:hypothetical protein